MDKAATKLLQDHDRSIRQFASSMHDQPPCGKCGDAIEVWWNYCAMCGYHLAAYSHSSRQNQEQKP